MWVGVERERGDSGPDTIPSIKKRRIEILLRGQNNLNPRGSGEEVGEGRLWRERPAV